MSGVSIIQTADGSHSLFNAALNETYHSIHGAIQESQHVFIRHGLEYWCEKNPSQPIRILEIGFGTGLNAFLTQLYATVHQRKIYYESWEAFPLEEAIYTQLNYADQLGFHDRFIKMHEAPWNKSSTLEDEFALHKKKADILVHPLPSTPPFDIIYYDAFAPSKQPELWTLEVLGKVLGVLAPHGVWITYCAKGQLKRDLTTLGLTVQTLEGPPGKKEMVRALR
jgi:tRNA U34 5-methylaminomethyl-2-thiouridine-forming methyltransferase MnmC